MVYAQDAIELYIKHMVCVYALRWAHTHSHTHSLWCELIYVFDTNWYRVPNYKSLLNRLVNEVVLLEVKSVCSTNVLKSHSKLFELFHSYYVTIQINIFWPHKHIICSSLYPTQIVSISFVAVTHLWSIYCTYKRPDECHRRRSYNYPIVQDHIWRLVPFCFFFLLLFWWKKNTVYYL